MTRYGASARHHDLDSASDTGRDYPPRSSGPLPRTFGRPARGHRGSTLGRAARPDPDSSDDESDFGSHSHHHHHHHHHGYAGSDDDSEFEARGHRHGHGRVSRDGPRIVVRANGTARSSGPSRFCGNDSSSSSSDESECGHHAAAHGGPVGGLRRRPEMRFDTDSSDDRGADLLSRGPGGRRSTAAHPLPRGRAAPRIGGEESDELDRHMAAARRARGVTGASRGGMMATPPSRAPRNGRAAGDRRGAV